MKELKLKDGTVVSPYDLVFTYGVVIDDDNPEPPEAHDVWYEDICEYFHLTLSQAFRKSNKWYGEVYHDKNFKTWVEETFQVQYPHTHLVCLPWAKGEETNA